MMEAAEKKSETSAVYAPIIVDLGKQRRKHVKRLRKGKPGRLLDDVQECLEELKASGTVAESVQPVVIIVKEEQTAAMVVK